MGDRLRAGIPSRYVTSQLGQLSLASLRGRLIEYQLCLDDGGNVISVPIAVWQPCELLYTRYFTLLCKVVNNRQTDTHTDHATCATTGRLSAAYLGARG